MLRFDKNTRTMMREEHLFELVEPTGTIQPVTAAPAASLT